MKKNKQILVAIDFSKCSIKALEFAICIANELTADVMMVHVDKVQSSESLYNKRGNEHQGKMVATLEKLVKKYQPSLKGTLEYVIRKGKVHLEIANQAKYSDAYLLVSGTHGVSGYEEFWIGSNAFRMVTTVPCPVITIRESFIWRQKHISSIVLPIDSTIETRQKVPFTTELAKLFGSTIHILGVYTSNLKDLKLMVEGYVNQAVEYIDNESVPNDVKYKFCDNITDGIIEYAKEVSAELITIMSEQEKSTKNIWLGPYAQQMVNHSPLPVLTVRSKNYYDAYVSKD